jgi:hypothetical protein
MNGTPVGPDEVLKAWRRLSDDPRSFHEETYVIGAGNTLKRSFNPSLTPRGLAASIVDLAGARLLSGSACHFHHDG